MKKVLHTTFFIHLLAMLMALLSVGAAFADGELSGTLESGLHWEIDGTTLRISGEGEMADMTQSSQPWAASKGTITKIEVGEGVTGIGDYAFYGCSVVTDVTLPETLKKIDFQAFGNCTSLVSIDIPAAVWTMGAPVFSNCAALEKLTIYGDSFRYPLGAILSNCPNTVVWGYNRTRAQFFAEWYNYPWHSMGEWPDYRTVYLNPADSLWGEIKDHTRIILADGLYDDIIQLQQKCDISIEAAHPGKVEFLTYDETRPVIELQTSQYINFSGLILGHKSVSTADGQYGCGGGSYSVYSSASAAQVLSASSSYHVSVDQCELWGCGLNAVFLKNSANVSVTNSILRDCVYGAVYASASQADFVNCMISGNSYHEEERSKPCIHYDGYFREQDSIMKLLFQGCHFFNNYNPALLGGTLEVGYPAQALELEKAVVLVDCLFHDNAFDGEEPLPYGLCFGGAVWEIEEIAEGADSGESGDNGKKLRVLHLGKDHAFRDGSSLTSEGQDVPPYSVYAEPWRKWEPDIVDGYCKLSFGNYGYRLEDPENGSRMSTDPKLLRWGESLGTLPVPKWEEGFTFLGWWTQKEGGEQVTADTNVPETAALTLYAHWHFEGKIIGFDRETYQEYDTGLTWELVENGTLVIRGDGEMPEEIALGFERYGTIRTVVFENGIRSIGSSNFHGLDTLETVYLPRSIRNIGMFAFSYCDKLALICYEGTQEEWKAVKLGDSNFGAGIGVELETIEIRFSTGWGPSLTLPAGLRRIESEAFAGIKNASFRVPATVEYIAPDAFDPSVTLRVPADSAAEEAAKGLEVTLVREK